MNMVFRRSAFEEGRRGGGSFSLPGAGCRSLGGRMPRSGGSHADDSSAFDAHGEGKGISGSDFPGFHAPSVIFFPPDPGEWWPGMPCFCPGNSKEWKRCVPCRLRSSEQCTTGFLTSGRRRRIPQWQTAEGRWFPPIRKGCSGQLPVQGNPSGKQLPCPRGWRPSEAWGTCK